MLSLLVLCLKVSRSSLKRVAVLTVLVVAILYFAGIRDYVLIGLILTWVFLDVPLQLKVKEKREGWQHFFLAVSNQGPKVSTYLQCYMLCLASLLVLLAVASHAALATLGIISASTGPAAGTIFKIVQVVVFYDMLLLFIADFVPLERLFLVQKLGFVVFVLLLRYVFVDISPEQIDSMLNLLLGPVLAFNYGLTFLLAHLAFKLKKRVAIGH